MRFVGVSFVVCLLLGGCQTTPEEERREVCQAFCQCLVTGATQVETCIVDDCLPDILTVSDDCLDCVLQNSQSCPTLLNQCPAHCTQQAPNLGGNE